MGQVIPFKKKSSNKKNTLCKSGFHKWLIVKDKQFDVKQGKLTTVFQCQRCQKIKTEWI